MNILIDIDHPAHVHLLRNTYFNLIKNGNNVFVTVKQIPSAIKLLELYNIPYINLGDKKDNLWIKGIEQILYDLKIWLLVIKYHIKIGVGSSITLAHVSRFSNMSSIILDDDDDDVEPLFVKYAHPFCNVILSPKCAKRKSPKAIFYDGLHELAYLHPNRFVPDERVLSKVGLSKNDVFFIMRFNAFKAHHDVGVNGLSIENKRKIIKLLSKYGKVFITTERNIDDEFMPYQLKIPQNEIHSMLYYATMFIGDSQTMTSESAVLGTPSIRCNSFVGRISYIEEEENKYHLTYGFLPENSEKMYDKIKEILSESPLKIKQEWKERKAALLKDKIDTTRFFTWFIENYPKSKKIMKENPEYQYRFK